MKTKTRRTRSRPIKTSVNDDVVVNAYTTLINQFSAKDVKTKILKDICLQGLISLTTQFNKGNIQAWGSIARVLIQVFEIADFVKNDLQIENDINLGELLDTLNSQKAKINK
jgi:hypothetical protein